MAAARRPANPVGDRQTTRKATSRSREMAFPFSRHGVLRCKTWRFTPQDTAFRLARHGLPQGRRPRLVSRVLSAHEAARVVESLAIAGHRSQIAAAQSHKKVLDLFHLVSHRCFPFSVFWRVSPHGARLRRCSCLCVYTCGPPSAFPVTPAAKNHCKGKVFRCPPRVSDPPKRPTPPFS